MPTYQYACTEPACGNRFEQVQSFTDPSVTECPVCDGRVRKVFGSVGVVFKGSGFYRTDSRTGAGPASGSSDGAKSEGKSESKSETKSDSKSESKSESKGSDSKPAAPATASTGAGTAKSA
ncbi:MAG TPA: FmdB family zinc ribbon protein [Jatrophihabitans sp.]|jgi:putative FmdB family regulatory protein